MKNILLVLLICSLVTHCNIQVPKSSVKAEKIIKPEKNEDDEWELLVFDTQYDYFLKAVAKPMNAYSLGYLKNKNTFLVSEWNSYYMSGKYRNIIESGIDYRPHENYGIEFEYKLYQVFAYVNWKYGLRMRNLSSRD